MLGCMQQKMGSRGGGCGGRTDRVSSSGATIDPWSTAAPGESTREKDMIMAAKKKAEAKPKKHTFTATIKIVTESTTAKIKASEIRAAVGDALVGLGVYDGEAARIDFDVKVGPVSEAGAAKKKE